MGTDDASYGERHAGRGNVHLKSCGEGRGGDEEAPLEGLLTQELPTQDGDCRGRGDSYCRNYVVGPTDRDCYCSCCCFCDSHLC